MGYVDLPFLKCTFDVHHPDHLLYIKFTGKVLQVALSLLIFVLIFHVVSTTGRAVSERENGMRRVGLPPTSIS